MKVRYFSTMSFIAALYHRFKRHYCLSMATYGKRSIRQIIIGDQYWRISRFDNNISSEIDTMTIQPATFPLGFAIHFAATQNIQIMLPRPVKPLPFWHDFWFLFISSSYALLTVGGIWGVRFTINASSLYHFINNAYIMTRHWLAMLASFLISKYFRINIIYNYFKLYH